MFITTPHALQKDKGIHQKIPDVFQKNKKEAARIH